MPETSSFWPQSDDTPPAWATSLAVSATVVVPGIGEQPRSAFLEWLWGQLVDCGIRGVCEGEVLAHDAAALGLVPTALVIDAAVAPPERDWVAELPVVTASCWFDDEASAHEACRRLAGLDGCEVIGVRRVTRERADAWKDTFPTVEIPGFGSVRPAWESGSADSSAGGTTLFIEPGIGFGTGLHPTTQLCLAAIAAAFRSRHRPDRVVDFGSGSGILAVAAAVLGATRVDAVESDASVHEAIRTNAARNDVANRIGVAPSLSGLTQLGGLTQPAHLVVANIVADVLLDHAAPLCSLVARDPPGRLLGCLVLSGLRTADLAGVSERFTAMLGQAPQRASRNGWECLVWHGRGARLD